jgi:hypothetical protein
VTKIVYCASAIERSLWSREDETLKDGQSFISRYIYRAVRVLVVDETTGMAQGGVLKLTIKDGHTYSPKANHSIPQVFIVLIRGGN